MSHYSLRSKGNPPQMVEEDLPDIPTTHLTEQQTSAVNLPVVSGVLPQLGITDSLMETDTRRANLTLLAEAASILPEETIPKVEPVLATSATGGAPVGGGPDSYISATATVGSYSTGTQPYSPTTTTLASTLDTLATEVGESVLTESPAVTEGPPLARVDTVGYTENQTLQIDATISQPGGQATNPSNNGTRIVR